MTSFTNACVDRSYIEFWENIGLFLQLNVGDKECGREMQREQERVRHTESGTEHKHILEHFPNYIGLQETYELHYQQRTPLPPSEAKQMYTHEFCFIAIAVSAPKFHH